MFNKNELKVNYDLLKRFFQDKQYNNMMFFGYPILCIYLRVKVIVKSDEWVKSVANNKKKINKVVN